MLNTEKKALDRGLHVLRILRRWNVFATCTRGVFLRSVTACSSDSLQLTQSPRLKKDVPEVVDMKTLKGTYCFILNTGGTCAR